MAAAEVFAFDALVLNFDRRPDNPNVLMNGRQLAIFDHELALLPEGLIGWRPPWTAGGLETLARRAAHVFFGDLSGKGIDLSRLRGAWLAITSGRLAEYRQALPTEWTSADAVVDQALLYLEEVQANIDTAIEEVERVLR